MCVVVTGCERHVVTVARVPLLTVRRASGAFLKSKAVNSSIFPCASSNFTA